MFKRDDFEADKRRNAQAQYEDKGLRKRAFEFLVESDKYDYGYQWTWLGLPFIQMPQDIVVTQEIIWQNKPDVIIETGIAWGGSIAFYASLLQLIGKGTVVGVDLNLMDHVSAQIMALPCSDRIHLYKGSSTEPSTMNKIRTHIKPGQSVMVVLDSNHTHEHVLEELKIYGPLVTQGQYLVAADTVIEDIPPQSHRRRPWGPGNNPKTALKAYLAQTDRFAVDETIDARLLMSFTPQGYCRCVKS